ncbi:MAG: class B sortase [Lachnospiraceae bacterium]|nr:class B sortase [Lachnospiraceae bacterium]
MKNNKFKACKISVVILLSLFSLVIFAGCGDTAEDVISREDVETFLAEEEADSYRSDLSTATDDDNDGTLKSDNTPTAEDTENTVVAPTSDQAQALKEAVISGMSEENTDVLTELISRADTETEKIYKEGIIPGNTGSGLLDDALGIEFNKELLNIKGKIESHLLDDDLDEIIELHDLASDTRDMGYIEDLYHMLSDMDRYLLNFDTNAVKEDYFGRLHVWEDFGTVSIDTDYDDDDRMLAIQDALRDVARKEVTPAYEDRILDDYRELYEYNDAVIGYIYIDGTVIDAPVLQTLSDYEYYLHRDIDGNESEPGCIILDADSEIGIGTAADGYLEGYEPSSIQLIHGHNMRNGTMFGSLLKYENESYADSHAYIQYDSLYEHRTYEVICAFYSEIYPEESDEFKYYTYNRLESEKEYETWRKGIDEMALYERNVSSGYDDEFIVLSTCAYQTDNGRFAVMGVRIR